VRAPVSRRVDRDWEDWQVSVGVWRHREGTPLPRVDQPRGLPHGWELVRSFHDILGSRDHVHLVRCPRAVRKPAAWVLLSQWTSPDGQTNTANQQMSDTTLGRLACELDRCLPEHTFKGDPWLLVRDRLWDTVAEFYDLDDPIEAAEATLRALSGRFRTLPRAALA
jgi:hypothetical protein